MQQEREKAEPQRVSLRVESVGFFGVFHWHTIIVNFLKKSYQYMDEKGVLCGAPGRGGAGEEKAGNPQTNLFSRS